MSKDIPALLRARQRREWKEEGRARVEEILKDVTVEQFDEQLRALLTTTPSRPPVCRAPA